MTTVGAERRSWWSRADAIVDAQLAKRSRAAVRDLAFADSLRTIAATTRSGGSLPQALQRASERSCDRAARACGEAASRIGLGRPVDAEVHRLAATIGTPAAHLFAQVVAVQHRRGGDLGGPCHRLAALLHERARLDAEARSATAQARFSARAVLAIPLLLALAAWWRAPDAVRAFLQPANLVLAAPGIVSIVAGALVARRIARTACDVGRLGAAPRRRRSGVARRIAGGGPRSRQSARLALATLACVAPLLALHASGGMLLCALVAIVAACAWPWSDASLGRRRRAAVARAGIESLLEISIALLSAGATAHEVATLAPASCEEPLRSALAPAVHLVGLGRTVPSAFATVPEVAALSQLDGWLHAICTSAEFGAPAVDVLEQLLRDARSDRREQLRSIAQTAAPRMQLALVLLVVPGVMWLMLLATVGGLARQLHEAGVV